MATFYIEALEGTTITLSTVGSPVVGTAKYGIDNTNPSTTYTYGDNISLSAGQKCYWTITSTTVDFSGSKFLNFTSTNRINVGGQLSDLIGGQSSIPRNYCFYKLFYLCSKLVDASNLILVNDFNSKTFCYAQMFNGCTFLTSAPELPATILAERCYSQMFFGCTNIKVSSTQTGEYQKPYRIPSSGTGTTATSALYGMFTGTGGTFTGTPEINTTYYLYGEDPYEIGYHYKVNYNIGAGTIVSGWQRNPVEIKYGNSSLVTINENSIVELDCANQIMSDNIIISGGEEDIVLDCKDMVMDSDCIITVNQQPLLYTMSITGSGGSNTVYVEYNGTKHYEPGTFSVPRGVTLYCYASGSNSGNIIWYNGTKVSNPESGPAQYYYTPSKDAYITLEFSPGVHGYITIQEHF